MPLTFSLIAPHIQLTTIRKLEYPDFVNFQQCSVESRSLGKPLKSKLPLSLKSLSIGQKRGSDTILLQYYGKNCMEHLVALSELNNLPVRIVSEKGDINLNKNEALSTFFEEIKVSSINVKCLSVGPAFRDSTPFNLSILDGILKCLQTEHLYLYTAETFVFNDQPEKLLKSIIDLQLGGEITPSIFYAINGRNIILRDMQRQFTAESINEYLKNPGAHSLQFKATGANQFNENYTIDALLNGLVYTLIWTKRTHRQSEYMDILWTRLWNGKAYVVFNGKIYLLLLVDDNIFQMDRLAGETMEEATANGRKLLRKLIENYAH